MTIAVNFTPTEEARLSHAALKSGIGPEELLRKLVNDYLPAIDSLDEMRRRLAEWQAEDNAPIPPLPVAQPGFSPSAALFDAWAEEDASKSPEEIAAHNRLWEDYKSGIDDQRRELGMRTLF